MPRYVARRWCVVVLWCCNAHTAHNRRNNEKQQFACAVIVAGVLPECFKNKRKKQNSCLFRCSPSVRRRCTAKNYLEQNIFKKIVSPILWEYPFRSPLLFFHHHHYHYHHYRHHHHYHYTITTNHHRSVDRVIHLLRLVVSALARRAPLRRRVICQKKPLTTDHRHREWIKRDAKKNVLYIVHTVISSNGASPSSPTVFSDCSSFCDRRIYSALPRYCY